MFEFVLAQADAATSVASSGFFDQIGAFFKFVSEHWQFCLLHFLNFGIWGCWYVVLGNMLNARGFSRTSIGRIYGTMPIGAMVTPLIIGPIADKYVATEVLIGVLHLIGGVVLLGMAWSRSPTKFYWLALLYALAYSPTLGLVNSIVFANNESVFGGTANEVFPWIRVFGTFGWIAAGLSHALILKKGEPVNERPFIMAGILSFVLGLFAFTLPHTPPGAAAPAVEAAAPAAEAAAEPVAQASVIDGSIQMLTQNPVFFGVTFFAAIAMGMYFAFSALFIEKKGVSPKTVGPLMTIGQFIEIFFMLSLPFFLGPDQKNMNIVLAVGIVAWAVRFALFAIGNPLALVLLGVAIHGICFDFFFAAGFINAAKIAPEGLAGTAQQFYGFLVYGLGMYIGSEGSGWLNRFFSREVSPASDSKPAEVETNWGMFWGLSAGAVAIASLIFIGVTFF